MHTTTDATHIQAGQASTVLHTVFAICLHLARQPVALESGPVDRRFGLDLLFGLLNRVWS